MITIPTKSVNYDQENIKFVHNLSYFCFGKNYFPVLLTVRVLLARSSKRNKRKVVSGSRVTLPENVACKPELSFDPLARVTPGSRVTLPPCKQGLKNEQNPHFDAAPLIKNLNFRSK